MVDEDGSVVILKNNVPRYVVIEFTQADDDQTASREDIMSVSKRIMEKNKDAYEELAK